MNIGSEKYCKIDQQHEMLQAEGLHSVLHPLSAIIHSGSSFLFYESRWLSLDVWCAYLVNSNFRDLIASNSFASLSCGRKGELLTAVLDKVGDDVFCLNLP